MDRVWNTPFVLTRMQFFEACHWLQVCEMDLCRLMTCRISESIRRTELSKLVRWYQRLGFLILLECNRRECSVCGEDPASCAGYYFQNNNWSVDFRCTQELVARLPELRCFQYPSSFYKNLPPHSQRTVARQEWLRVGHLIGVAWVSVAWSSQERKVHDLL